MNCCPRFLLAWSQHIHDTAASFSLTHHFTCQYSWRQYRVPNPVKVSDTQSNRHRISTKFVIKRWSVCMLSLCQWEFPRGVCVSFMIPGYKWQKTVKHFEMWERTSRALYLSKYCHKYLKRSFCPGVQVLCSAAQRPIHTPSTKM